MEQYLVEVSLGSISCLYMEDAYSPEEAVEMGLESAKEDLVVQDWEVFDGMLYVYMGFDDDDSMYEVYPVELEDDIDEGVQIAYEHAVHDLTAQLYQGGQ